MDVAAASSEESMEVATPEKPAEVNNFKPMVAIRISNLCFSQQQPAANPSDEVRDEDGGIHVDGIYIPPPPPPALTFDNKGPRLVITHIENHNFKSYFGTRTLGPFHKSFTSIVGPNGSGKSNVIDSMLFVFGYRAQKIRSKKISVLIHDSDNHPDIRSCTVKVFFQVKILGYLLKKSF